MTDNIDTMAETDITFRDVISTTIHVDNSSDDSRTSDISADASIQDGRVRNLQSGVCTDIENPQKQTQFSWGDGYLNCSFYGYTDAAGIIDAVRDITAFVAEVKTRSIE